MLVGVLKMWCFPKKECVFCQEIKDNPNFNVVFEVRSKYSAGRHALPRLPGVFVELPLTQH